MFGVVYFFWLGKSRRKGHLGAVEYYMPVQTFLVLLVAVIAAAGVTIVLAYVLGVNFVWLGLTAAIAALVIRKWA